ncbi:thermonuclease family protein [Deinococcus sp.]|uniref:thermonuclease family protein n=1 Tax=Deinococcus sp. TaxID=47478 RepID=UPI003919CEDC
MLRCSPLLLSLLGTTHAAPAPLVGVASVIDGDTLEIRGVRVRLYGIDAPESSRFWQLNFSRASRAQQAA